MNNIMLRHGSFVRRASARLVVLSLCAMVMGCVAQQADVVRIKRELDAKISQLDKSKTSLQQAVNEANEALGKANILIAQQRSEIKELLHARAEMMEQVATLKETDLSQVRGALEKNQHQVNELNQSLTRYDEEMKEVKTRLQQSDPLVNQLRDRLAAEEKLLTEQGGKLGEFRNSLVDYQQVLTSLRHNVAQQEQQVVEVRKHMEIEGQKRDIHGQQIKANFEEIRRSIQSVVGTLEKVSTTFGRRLDEHEQQLSRMAGQQGGSISSKDALAKKSELKIEESRTLLDGMTPTVSSLGPALPSQSSKRNSPPIIAGTVSAFSPATTVPRNLPAVTGPSSQASFSRSEIRDPQVMYEGALTLLRQGNFTESARKFSTFLRSFPDSPLAANAQYWLGECFYGERRFQEAIDEFERVFAFYPFSNKVPASLLKIGYSHLELQQPSMARSVFQQLVRIHPQSSEAVKAQDRLQEVNALLDNPS